MTTPSTIAHQQRSHSLHCTTNNHSKLHYIITYQRIELIHWSKQASIMVTKRKRGGKRPGHHRTAAMSLARLCTLLYCDVTGRAVCDAYIDSKAGGFSFHTQQTVTFGSNWNTDSSHNSQRQRSRPTYRLPHIDRTNRQQTITVSILHLLRRITSILYRLFHSSCFIITATRSCSHACHIITSISSLLNANKGS